MTVCVHSVEDEDGARYCSLFVRAVVLAIKEKFSSRCMPSSLKDLELGFS